MANNYMSANSYFGLALEGTRGTAASVSTFTPITSPKVEAKVKWLADDALRGSPVKLYDDVPGVRVDNFSGKTYLYLDTFPQIIRGALGSPDVVASVSASVWSHTIGLYNVASVGSQPPSYTIVNNSVDNCYQLTAAQLNDLSLSFGAEAAVEATFSYVCNSYTTIAGPNIVESTQHLIPGWNCLASIGGASVATVMDGTLDIKRSTAAVHTLGSQGPFRNWAGPIEGSGKLTLLMDSTSPILGAGQANALTRDQQTLVLKFIDPVTLGFVEFQMSAVQFKDPVVDQGKAYVAVTASFDTVSNTTDDTMGGYSPVQAVIQNAVSTAY